MTRFFLRHLRFYKAVKAATSLAFNTFPKLANYRPLHWWVNQIGLVQMIIKVVEMENPELLRGYIERKYQVSVQDLVLQYAA